MGAGELRDKTKRPLKCVEHPGDKEGKRERLPPGLTIMKEAQALCPEAIALRQYVNNVTEAELPAWVQKAGFRPGPKTDNVPGFINGHERGRKAGPDVRTNPFTCPVGAKGACKVLFKLHGPKKDPCKITVLVLVG